MSYKYPEHFKYPSDVRIYFTDHLPVWEKHLSDFKNRSNICLEIGALYGGSSVYMLEEFCKEEGSHHYIMDINTNEFIENNVGPYKNKLTYLLGESTDSFKTFSHDNQTKEFLDIVYIDGNHLSKYVLEDAVNSFYCLKNYGIMIFDDFGGGLEQEAHLQVKTGVDSFIHAYRKYVNVIHIGYQLILQKIEHISEFEMKENYYKI